MKFFLSLIFILAIVSSCTRTKNHFVIDNNQPLSQKESAINELQPHDYVTWISNPENGLIKKQKVEDLSYSLQYKPADYMVCMEERKDNISANELSEKRKEYSELEYYDLKIEMEKGQGELLKHHIPISSSYEQRVNYYAFKMQKDIYMVSAGDTISCAMFHFERAYDIAPYSKFLLAFAKTKNDKDKIIVFDDKIFNKGIFKFRFSQEEIKNIPTVKAI